MTYVGNLLIFRRNQTCITKLEESLKKAGTDIKRENDEAGFLGVDIETGEKGKVKMTQTGLIDRIVQAMGLEDANPKSTPTKAGTLLKNEKGDDCNGSFNYASVVGILLYLEGHTRPDISFPVNQSARYTFHPKRSHEEALKHIDRYLKATRDK